jgi:hypothetical protein
MSAAPPALTEYWAIYPGLPPLGSRLATDCLGLGYVATSRSCAGAPLFNVFHNFLRAPDKIPSF